MLFISVEDFFEKTKGIPALEHGEERALAEKMKAGDKAARQRLVEAYLPSVAAHIRRLHAPQQSLELVMRCCRALEKAVDGFDFLQDSESFSHRLSWWLRQTTAEYIADKSAERSF